MYNYRTYLKSYSSSSDELTVNSVKRKSLRDAHPAKNIKKPRRAESNHYPSLPLESMVIFNIYHRTNNYGHTNLGALMLKYDRIMRYKQRHIIIKATPHDQSTLLVTCVE